ncbi:MAG: CHAT domain-containing protein [Nitrospirae bacterium]|nr:CHAT domain-containing protein [Nitrospirota bacterium]MCL5978773.1 CHAT domain-containing protein [Nitrospirota bacterium]
MKQIICGLFVVLAVLFLCNFSSAEIPQEELNRAKALFEEGQKRLNSSDFRGAIEKWEKALAIAEEIGYKKGKGTVLGNLAAVYSILGDYRKAIDYIEKALAIADEIGDKEGKGRHLGNLGLAYSDLGDYRKAIDYYEKALAIAEEIGYKKGKGTVLGMMGNAYYGLGDYRNAIDYSEKELAIAEEIGDKSGKVQSFGKLGNIYHGLGDYRKAIDYLEKSLAIAEEIGDKQNKGQCLGLLGLAYSDLGDYGKAISFYEKALAIAEEIGAEHDKWKRLGNLADAYLAINRDEDAFSIYKKQDHEIRLGRYYLKKKDFKEAVKQFERDREKNEKAKSAGLIIPKWIGLGISHEGLKNYEEAYKWYTKAIAFMEDQRNSLSPSEREHYFEGNEFDFPRIEAYEGAVRCAFMLGRYDEAFYWAENTRGRIFSELLSKRHSGKGYKIPSQLAKEEEDLTSQIMMNKKQQQTAFEKNNPELLKQLETEYPSLKAKMDNLIDRLRREYPQYASIKYPQPAKLSQLALNKGETIIEYEVTDPYAIGFVIRDGKIIKAFKVDKTRTELSTMITKYRSPFQEGADINSFNVNLGADLTALLLKPALSEINRGERLIIVSDESLSLLPFESLVLSMPSAKSKDHIYAIDEYPISYYQSASVLSLQRGLHTARTKEKSFFGLGDPVYGKDDGRIASLRGVKIVSKETQAITDSQATKDAGYKFDRLVNTEKEIKEVGKLFGSSKLLIGSDASEAKLKAEDLRTRRYILFSTHGILGNEIPYIKQPALVLNLIGNDKEDGFLTASEIFEMDLNADIVGLSACKTGLGVQSAGEGVVGLSRAFMYAGTDTVLVSLWSVADESTYKLMAKFFDGLKNGKDKMTALKEAKNYLRNNGYDNPFYWASFILMGEAN